MAKKFSMEFGKKEKVLNYNEIKRLHKIKK